MDYLADLSQQVGVSRSRLLQDIADVLATRYSALVKKPRHQKNTLLDLAGIVKATGSQVTYTSTKPDSDYFGV